MYIRGAKSFAALLEGIYAAERPELADLGAMLCIEDPEKLQSLFEFAAAVRRQFVGDGVLLRGIIEFSDVCRNTILLDVMMTTKNEGFNVARELHDDQKLKDTPIIIMTGIRREMNLPFGFEPDEAWLPVKRVLEKPVKPEVLLSAIAETIRKR
jgi:CheY-like chemotaxis protein